MAITRANRTVRPQRYWTLGLLNAWPAYLQDGWGRNGGECSWINEADTGVPRGGLGVQTPIESSKNFVVCVCKIYSPSPALMFIKSKIVLQENVRNCTLISHFASASGGLRPPDSLQGLCPWTPLGDFRLPDPLVRPPPRQPYPL